MLFFKDPDLQTRFFNICFCRASNSMIRCIYVFVSYCLPCTLKPLPLVCMKFSVLRCSICLSYTGIGNVFLFRKDEGLFRTGHTNQRTNCPCKLLVTYYFNLSLNCVTYGAALLLARLLYWTRAGVYR